MPDRSPLIDLVLIYDISWVQMERPRPGLLGCDKKETVGHPGRTEFLILVACGQGDARPEGESQPVFSIEPPLHRYSHVSESVEARCGARLACTGPQIGHADAHIYRVTHAAGEHRHGRRHMLHCPVFPDRILIRGCCAEDTCAVPTIRATDRLRILNAFLLLLAFSHTTSLRNSQTHDNDMHYHYSPKKNYLHALQMPYISNLCLTGTKSLASASLS
jgi:hypothetical protein